MGWKRRVGAPLRGSVQLEQASPAIRRGLRSAVAAAGPLVVASLLDEPSFVWVGFAGLLTSVADRGGGYGFRARVMFGVGLTCALAAFAASLAGRIPWVAVIAICAWTFAASLGWVWGPRAGVVGRMSAIVFAASLFTPAPTVGAALLRGALFLVGALWSIVLALSLWPFRPFLPARRSVSACWRALARNAAGLASLAGGRSPDRAFVEHLRRHDPEVREALEEARGIVVAIRRGGTGESRRGERLVVLLEGAYRLSSILDGIADQLEWLVREPGARPLLEESARLLGAFAARAQAVAGVARDPRRAEEYLLHPAETRGGRPSLRLLDLGPLRTAAAGRPAARPIVGLFERLADFSAASAATAARQPSGISPIPFEARELRRPPIFAPLRDHLTFRSAFFRHALRVAAIAGVSTATVLLAGLEKGQWLVLAAISTLMPYYGATFQRGLQRVAGTIGGGILAALVAAVAHGAFGVPIVVFAFSAIGVSLLPLNFGLYYTFLTPAFLILAEPGAADWHLVGIRIENAVIGGFIAVIGSWLLWPSLEVKGIPVRMAQALRADDAHLRDALDGAPAETLRRSRRQAGIAAAEAEGSFQRLLSEGHAGDKELESLMTIVTYTRRLEATITTITEARSLRIPIATVGAVGPAAHRVLTDLADALERSRPPAGFPPETAWPASGDPFAESLIRRLERQLSVLHAAVSRLQSAWPGS